MIDGLFFLGFRVGSRVELPEIYWGDRTNFKEPLQLG